jgi:hypothetical protein
MYEIAYLYEMGVDGLLWKNHVLAVEYLRGITFMSQENADREFLSEFARTHIKDNKDFHETDNVLEIER